MTKFKTTIHCGQVSTFAVNEHESKREAFDKIEADIKNAAKFLELGDVLICVDKITFVVVEELIERTEEPAAGATIEA